MVLEADVLVVKCKYYSLFLYFAILHLLFSVFEETAEINSEEYCHECVSVYFPNNAVKFEKSDAKLSCPEGECDVKNLSVDQFIVGSCCKKASVSKHESGIK